MASSTPPSLECGNSCHCVYDEAMSTLVASSTRLCGVFAAAAAAASDPDHWRERARDWDESRCWCWRLVNYAGAGDEARVAILVRMPPPAGYTHIACSPGPTVAHVCFSSAAITFAGERLTPVLAAVRGGHTRVITQLVEAGFAPDARTETRLCPVIAACDHADISMLQFLYRTLPRCRDPDTRDQPHQHFSGAHNWGNHRAPLATVAAGNLPVDATCALLQFMVERLKLDVNFVDFDRDTPVLAAITAGRTKVWRFLVQELGAEVDPPRMRPRGAVYLALRNGRFETAAELVHEFGARVELEYEHPPASPLDGAITSTCAVDPRYRDFLRSVVPLLSADHIQQHLMRVLEYAQWSLARFLVENGASLDCTCIGGHYMHPPLAAALSRISFGIRASRALYARITKTVECILECGADPNMPCNMRMGEGETEEVAIRPFGVFLLRMELAVVTRDTRRLTREIITLLFRFGLDVDLPVIRLVGYRHNTMLPALHAAAMCSQAHAVAMICTRMHPASMSLVDVVLRDTIHEIRAIPMVDVAATLAALLHAGAVPGTAPAVALHPAVVTMMPDISHLHVALSAVCPTTADILRGGTVALANTAGVALRLCGRDGNSDGDGDGDSATPDLCALAARSQVWHRRAALVCMRVERTRWSSAMADAVLFRRGRSGARGGSPSCMPSAVPPRSAGASAGRKLIKSG